MALMFLNNKLLFTDGKLAMSPNCCCSDNPPVVMSCSSYTFTLPTYITVNFPTLGNGTCATCTGKGGTRTLKLSSTSIGSVICFAGTCCSFQYDLCQNGVDFAVDNGGTCPGSGQSTGWILAFFVPTDGTSNYRVLARLSTFCIAEIVWDGEFTWRNNFMSFSESLTLQAAATNTQCTGLTSPITASV